MRRRARDARRRALRIFFASDIHGSDRCFRKFLAAATAYEADLLLLGGDLVAKGVVPILAERGKLRAQVRGEPVEVPAAEEPRLLADINRIGLYGVRLDAEEIEALREDPTEVDRVLRHEIAAEEPPLEAPRFDRGALAVVRRARRGELIRETVVERSNGSKIAVAWVGDPSGRPVLLCHGLADSRLAARPLESAARGLGLCVIAPDRPGMGRTDFRTFRRLSGWTDDARTILAELDVRSVAILGISAGSAFAAACAALLPSRVNKLLLVSPLGEPAWGTRGMATGARLSTLISTWFPAANGWLFARLANLAQRSPERFMRLATGELPSIDRDALARPRDRAAYLAGYLDAFRAGPAGVTQDLRLLRRAWGFELSSIRAPTWVHHGTVDTSVPPLHAHRFAAAIPGAQLVLHPGHGHFSLDLSTAVLEPAFGQGC